MATLFPVIFLGVAAFLLNVVLTRLIGSQRDQIAILKAFGYSNVQVGAHYTQLVLLIIALGLAIGIAAGLWLGQQMAEVYRAFFHFPFLEYTLRTRVIVLGALVAIVAGLAGTLAAVRRAVLLPPAEAMRPEPPPVFRATFIERAGLQRYFSQPTRMILRAIERRPAKALLSVVGIAMACGILMVGRFQEGAIDFLIKVQYGLAQRDDLSVTFVEPVSARAIAELAALPGVDHVEPIRVVPARIRFGTASYRTAVQGLASNGSLKRVLDQDLRVVDLPPDGLVLNDFLASHLRAGPGDRVTVEILEGRRDVREVAVVGVIREYTGAAAYMELARLNRLMHEDAVVSGALMAVQPGYRGSVVAALKKAPRVAGVTDRYTAVRNFYESMADVVLVFALISTVLAGSIAFGVVYNNARIALTERSRELASLRVLGYTRGEISYILLGELALLTAAAVPVGFAVGVALIAYIIHGLESDLYRIPLIVTPAVYSFAALVIVVSALLSGAVVARRLATLDLVAVLKTKE
jgi:putative ABC transport system permease protein